MYPRTARSRSIGFLMAVCHKTKGYYSIIQPNVCALPVTDGIFLLVFFFSSKCLRTRYFTPNFEKETAPDNAIVMVII